MAMVKDRRRLSGQTHEGLTLTGADCRNALAIQAVFKGCTFKSVRFSRGIFNGSLFEDCLLLDCDFTQSSLRSIFRRVDCRGSDFSQSSFEASVVEESVFKECRFDYVSFVRTTVVKSNFTDSNFHGAVMDFADSDQVDFTGSNFWGAVIPINCAFLVGNQFDQRQVELLIALLLKTRDDDGWIERTLGNVPSVYNRRLVERLVQQETVDRDRVQPDPAADRPGDIAVGDEGQAVWRSEPTSSLPSQGESE